MSQLPRPPVRIALIVALTAAACVAGVKPLTPPGTDGGPGGKDGAAPPPGIDAPVVPDARPNLPEVTIAALDGGEV